MDMQQSPVTPGKKTPLSGAHPPKFNFWSSLGTTISIAIVVATLFTIWTPASLFSNRLAESLAKAMNAQENPNLKNLPTKAPYTSPHIGLVAGHSGEEKPGFVCPDGTREVDVNNTITTLVRQKLVERGFTVDMMSEFDPNLRQYQGMFLLSIHTDTCEYIDDGATGFKLAPSMYSTTQETKLDRLSSCIISKYQETTGLKYQNYTTDDMTKFHPFDEVHIDTPTLIMEPGYLNLDKELLTKQADLVAQGIANGLFCYLGNEPNIPTPAPSTQP
jgi:N-acetylmuramoyl-L-alanine amidase